MPPFSCVSDFAAYLDGLGQFRMLLGLERMQTCMQRLGLDAPPFKVARVVGTNGKGAVSWMLARLAAEQGLSVGLFTSPHFLSPKERIQLLDAAGPHMPDDAGWLELANMVYEAGPAAPMELVQRQAADEEQRRELHGLTYFEFLTVMALLHFARQGVELAVMEAGLGARYDATAALTAELACITPIGLDHENILGHGLTAIAAEKAHALKQGAALALSAPQRPEAWQELEKASQEGGTPLMAVTQAPPPPLDPADHLRLPGSFQAGNARLALACWQALAARRRMEVDWQACARALERVRLPGRMQLVHEAQGPDLLLDGAHNEDGLLALEGALQAEGLRPCACVAGFMQDKDLPRLLPILRRMVQGALVFPELAEIPRAASAAQLAAACGQNARVARDVPAALELARSCSKEGQGLVLVCGSLYLLGEFFKVRPELVTFS